MFYLKEFFKSIGEAPVRGASFILFSCLLALSLTHRPWIIKNVERITPEKMVNPYFVAVIDGSVNTKRVKDFLEKLPGVLTVDEGETERSQSKLSALVRQLGPDYSLDSGLMNFQSMRIVMNPSLSTESLDFVRSQVVKMGGKDHVTATEIKFPEVSSVMKAHPFYEFVTKAGDWGVIGILSLFWIVSYWLCYSVFRARSYLIEKFQRKNLVAAKSIATGLSLIFVIFSAAGIWNGTLKVFDLVLLFMVFSIFWTFSMQDWKWKPTL